MRIVVILFFWVGFAAAQSISVDTIITGKMSVRAILPDGNKIWYAANHGRFGFYDCSDNTTFEEQIVFDSIKPEFRSIAQTSESIFVLAIGSPALLYKIDKQTRTVKLVYRETHKNAFYDAMAFWNDTDGIAIGDPIRDKFSILITHDGGDNWAKIDAATLPETAPGEAAFAASNTNINLDGDKVWIVTGGTRARVFYSPDKGNSWQAFNTPIDHGKTMIGIFTADFYDENSGIAAGGDYENPEQNSGNKAITKNGGKTWDLIAENKGFGYASCIQYVPGSNAKGIICVGATGIWYSSDSGLAWTKLSNDCSLYTIRFTDSETAFAAGKDKIVRIRLKK